MTLVRFSLLSDTLGAPKDQDSLVHLGSSDNGSENLAKQAEDFRTHRVRRWTKDGYTNWEAVTAQRAAVCAGIEGYEVEWSQQ